MKNRIKGFVLGILCTLLVMNTVVYAATSHSMIEVMMNQINVALDGEQVAKINEDYTLSNGEKVPFSISYKGTTYLPMRKVAELLGKEVTWDGKTKTAGIVSENTKNDIKVNDVKKSDGESIEKEAIIKNLKASLDFISIDGAESDPYFLDIDEAQVFVIAKNNKDFQTFSGLAKDEKKRLLNDLVQDNFGSYLGVTDVYADFVYNGLSYANILTGYGKKLDDLNILTFDSGERVVVLRQIVDEDYLLTYEYYYDNPSQYIYALTDEEIKEAMKEGQKGVRNVLDIETEQYTFKAESNNASDLTVLTPYLNIMRSAAYAKVKHKSFTFDDAKALYNEFCRYHIVDFSFDVYTKSKDGHKDATVLLIQDNKEIDDNSFVIREFPEEGQYNPNTKKYRAGIVLDYSNMLADVNGRQLFDYSKKGKFKVILGDKTNTYNIDLSKMK